MLCKELTDRLDDYADGRVDRPQSDTLAAHIEHCAECSRILAAEIKLRGALKDYGESTMPQTDTAFFDAAMARAASSGTRRQRNRWVMTGVGGTIAAGLVLWVLGTALQEPLQDPQLELPAIAMTIEEPRRLNLVFSATSAMADATMTVLLPAGVELEGFAGQREISWLTSLTPGKNVLPLTLIATSPQGGELLATLRHAGDDKTFRVRLDVI